MKKKRHALSDSEGEEDNIKKSKQDNEEEIPGPSSGEIPEEAPKTQERPPDVFDDSDDGIDNGRESNYGQSDFEIMLQRKREEQSKRRKRKDIDIINDNDDIIAQLLVDMRNAAEVYYF